MQVEVTETDQFGNPSKGGMEWNDSIKYQMLTLWLYIMMMMKCNEWMVDILVASIRPEMLRDGPMGNTLSSRDLAAMRKERKKEEKEING